MISITKSASEKLSSYLAQNKLNSPVRISVISGCGGSSLNLALDEQKNGDYAHEDESFTLLIDQDLSQSCGKVTIDYVENGSTGDGFSLTSERPLPQSGDGCGGSCSSNGCGC